MEWNFPHFPTRVAKFIETGVVEHSWRVTMHVECVADPYEDDKSGIGLGLWVLATMIIVTLCWVIVLVNSAWSVWHWL